MDKNPLIGKCLMVGIILILLLLVFLSINLSVNAKIQRTIYVDDDNVYGPWDGTQEHPFRRILDSVVACSENDIIFVYNGFYREELFVNKSINLIGENKNNTIISEGYYSNIHQVVQISAENVTISNFTITNSKTDSTVGYGIYVVNSTGIVISNNVFNSNSNLWSSINIENSSQCIVTKNFIDGGNGSDFMNEYGIIVGSSFNSLISYNLIQFHWESGIGLFNASNITILENKLLQNGYGCLIDLNSSNDILPK
ncbi:Right handed beta helix region [uncultured archaeon]|nr:Right handed beta helix region [uncultured archaeon]